MADIIKVVMVDDDQGACHMVKQGLDATGKFQVVTTTHSADAEAFCRQEKPDDILLDNVMPERKGADLAKVLKSDEEMKNVPIVMVSGKGEMVYLEKKKQFHWEPNNPAVKDRGELVDSKNPEVLSEAYGVDDYISKPFSLEILIQVVEDVLEKVRKNNVKEEDDEGSGLGIV